MGRERDREGMGRERDRERERRAKGREREKSGREKERAYLTDSRKSRLKRGRACFTENRSVKQAQKQDKFFFLVFH
jgi:hypothetical protein